LIERLERMHPLLGFLLGALSGIWAVSGVLGYVKDSIAFWLLATLFLVSLILGWARFPVLRDNGTTENPERSGPPGADGSRAPSPPREG